MGNKVSYAKLNLKVNTDVNTFKFMDNDIEVLQYLPIEDKYDLIMVALQKSKEDDVYNELMLDMYFHLHMVYMYTNITFTDKQRENETKIYDTLCSNGFFDSFLSTINEDEYNNLLTMLSTIKEDKMNYTTTASAVVQKLIVDLPKNAEAAAKIVDNFDPEQYKRVVNFAKAAGKTE